VFSIVAKRQGKKIILSSYTDRMQRIIYSVLILCLSFGGNAKASNHKIEPTQAIKVELKKNGNWL
jgi:hypothetical protein